MLALDMAQWNDLQVVTYERSLDLLRDAGLDEKPRIGLDEARAMARKAGVWTVVMGVVSSTPDSLIVRATLYDVASGRGLDEAQRATSLRADPRTLYDQVARDLLDLVGAPALSVDVTKRTTASLAAYRNYLDGVRLLNGWRLLEADSAFARAIAADSSFALAYYKRTLEIGWRNPLDPEHARSAQQAVRHAERLPPRERELVGAYSELAQGLSALQKGDTTGFARLGEAQRRYDALVRSDPTDAEAWYGLGDAWFHQARPYQEKNGTTRDPSPIYTRALRAFDRTIALDSTFHLAYSHKILIYNSAGSPQSALMLAGDSVYLLADTAARRAMGPERIAAAKARARALAIRDATHWVELDPDAQQSYVSLADTYAAAGFADSAARVLERALARPAIHAPELAYRAALLRLSAGTPEAALASLRDALTRYPADSLRRWGSYQRFPLVMFSANVAAANGSLADLHRVMTTAAEAEPRVPNTELRTEPLVRWYEAALQLGMGVPVTPALRRTIDTGIRFADTLPTLIGTNVQGSSTAVPYVAFLATRDTSYLATARRWAKTTGLPSLPELDAVAALGAGDTARAAALAKEFPAMRPDAQFSYAGLRAMTRAEVLIGLGDLRGAVAIYEALDPRRFNSNALVEPGWPLYARSFLARGEAYEQLGDRAKAEASYQRFLDLWKEADPSLQGQLQRARDGLRRLRDAPGTAKVGG
jgi:tetratricopeptide (TPR) repeat protein